MTPHLQTGRQGGKDLTHTVPVRDADVLLSRLPHVVLLPGEAEGLGDTPLSLGGEVLSRNSRLVRPLVERSLATTSPILAAVRLPICR